GCASERTVNEQGNGMIGIQTPNHLDGSEGVVPQRECLDAPALPGGLANNGEPGLRFRGCDDLQIHAALREQRRAKLPVSQVNGEQQDALLSGARGLEMFPTGQFTEKVVNGKAALVPPEVGKFEGELLEQLASRHAR